MTIRTLILLLLIPGVAAAQTPQRDAPGASDSTAIRQVALDYIEGFYTGDADRVERALHPDLAKRIVTMDPRMGAERIDHQSALTLVQGTAAGYGTRIPEDRRRSDVTILDVFGGSATVKIVASDWIDYLHITKVNGEWKIINVLWEMSEGNE